MLSKIVENFIYECVPSFIRETEEGFFSSLNPLKVFPFPPPTFKKNFFLFNLQLFPLLKSFLNHRNVR